MRSLPGAILSIIVASVLLAGCTKYADQNQMQQLSDLKKEVATLEQQIKTAEQEKADLQKQIADKQAQINQVKENEKFVQQKLQQAQSDSTQPK
jgi:septal ring factor EnvC (AmiA/AmiB activator)